MVVFGTSRFTCHSVVVGIGTVIDFEELGLLENLALGLGEEHWRVHCL